MSTDRNNIKLSDLLGLVALILLANSFLAFLKDDSGKIVSSQGASVLEDETKMQKVSEAIAKSKISNSYGTRESVVVNLD